MCAPPIFPVSVKFIFLKNKGMPSWVEPQQSGPAVGKQILKKGDDGETLSEAGEKSRIKEQRPKN